MVLGIVSILIFVHILSPVDMYYVYDETPNVGFVNDDNDKSIGIVQENISVGSGNKDPLSFSLHSMYNRPEKIGTGRRFHSNSRSGIYVVDSHFKVLKAPPAQPKPLKFNVEPQPPRTEPPVDQQRIHVEEPAIKALEAKNYVPITGYAPPNYVRDANPMAGVQHTKPYNKVSRDHHDPYLINVHKTQVTSGQKVKFNGNQFANIRRDDNEGAVSAVGLQNKLEEIHKQPKQVYNVKKLERRHYDETEYQKDPVIGTGADSNLIKLPIENDNFKIERHVGEVPRIGGWEESVDVKPYALFYRISQDPSKRQFDNVQHFINEDDNEIKDNFAEHDVLHNAPPAQPTISASSIKLRMKIKKYSNFRSH